jgi:hypothetical protein
MLGEARHLNVSLCPCASGTRSLSVCDGSDTRLQGAPSLRLSRSSVDAEALPAHALAGRLEAFTIRSDHI